MEVERVYDSSNMTNINSTVLLPSEKLSTPSGVLDCLWISNSSPSFHGPTSMVNFEDCRGEIAKEMSFFPTIDKEAETSNDDFDSGCFHQPEKKRRLLPNQVQFLERSFEVENKLEPERKVQLAKELGLQPRQVAIWFQNRRARYKTKQLEKDYDVLKASFDKLKADYDTLFKENENLRNEVHLLTEKYHTSENSISKSISPLVTEETQKATIPIVVTSDVPVLVCKQEDATSAKSDVLDSDSPTHYSSFFEPADSSHVYEQEPSDFSQDEDDNLSKGLLPPLFLPKIGDHIQANSCNLGFQIEDQPYWSWQY